MNCICMTLLRHTASASAMQHQLLSLAFCERGPWKRPGELVIDILMRRLPLSQKRRSIGPPTSHTPRLLPVSYELACPWPTNLGITLVFWFSGQACRIRQRDPMGRRRSCPRPRSTTSC